jgi:pyruvate/2-oxoglutarate dehydrogenase complex dihydrolipoamide dehydrogenase (E3) component
VGTEATADSVQALAPDVVVATGGRPATLPVPGLEQALSGEAVLRGQAVVGARVLIVGGGLVGVELAELLAGQGKAVTIVELLDELARDMEAISRKLILARLGKLPVTLRPGTRIEALADGMAQLNGPAGAERLGPFDSVVVAVGTRPVRELAAALQERGVATHVVGDALEPKQIMQAVRSAWQVARAL